MSPVLVLLAVVLLPTLAVWATARARGKDIVEDIVRHPGQGGAP